MEITKNSQNISIQGHLGTWYTIDTMSINGKEYFLMEHETYGDEAASVIIDKQAAIVLEDVYNGFDDLLDELEEGAEKNRTQRESINSEVKHHAEQVQAAPVVGVLYYPHSGEEIGYTDPQEYLAEYKRSLEYMGINGVKPRTITTDIETHFLIDAVGAGEFGYELDRDKFFALAKQYGFDKPWPESALIEDNQQMDLSQYDLCNNSDEVNDVDLDGPDLHNLDENVKKQVMGEQLMAAIQRLWPFQHQESRTAQIRERQAEQSTSMRIPSRSVKTSPEEQREPLAQRLSRAMEKAAAQEAARERPPERQKIFDTPER